MAEKQKMVTVVFEIKDCSNEYGKLYTKNERIIFRMSYRLYNQTKNINYINRTELKYCNRMAYDILNSGSPQWWPALMIWDAVHRGTLL